MPDSNRPRTPLPQPAEHDLATVVEALVTDAVAMVGSDARVFYWNRSAVGIFEFFSEEMRGQTVLDLCSEDEGRASLAAAMAPLLVDERDPEAESRSVATPITVLCRRSSGVAFPVEITLSPISVQSQRCVVLLMRDVSRRAQLENELLRLATTDPLTGTMSRQHFLQRSREELTRAWRTLGSTSFLIVDVDHLRTINERCGDAVGDAVLKRIASESIEDLRTSDLLGRLEGGEFAALLPDTPLQNAGEVAERLRKRLGDLVHEGSTDPLPLFAQVSIGVVEHLRGQENLEDTLRRGEAALARAKQAGGNREWVDTGDVG